MLQVHVITIFPELFDSPLSLSILKRAAQKKLAQYHIHNLRDWTDDNHKTVDDRPFGGGPGMVMMLEPLYKAVTEIKNQLKSSRIKVVLTSAKGGKFTQERAEIYSKLDALIIICGHYEGVDERVAEHLADEEISIGDYVLTGGELPALVMIDAAVRLLPGVLGNEQSLAVESHGDELLHEAPQYTRPAEFVTPDGEKWPVPGVLLSGDHAKIEAWRSQNARKKSLRK
jgi:tRNA (guanine37-N1)-methyltransferase